jgi:hypothetical protein
MSRRRALGNSRDRRRSLERRLHVCEWDSRQAEEVTMKRRIGRWIATGLFAALPLTGGMALAQSASDTVPKTDKIPSGEPAPSQDTLKSTTGDTVNKADDTMHKDVNPPSDQLQKPSDQNLKPSDQKPIDQTQKPMEQDEHSK